MSKELPKVTFRDLGNIGYAEAFDCQKSFQSEIIAQKRAGELPLSHLLFCEHNPVYTLGKSGDVQNLVYSESQLSGKGIEYHKTNRGGDITYHGPGQITGYPIFDLDQYYNDVHRYVRELEQVVIRTIAEFGLKGNRLDGFTGVWLLPDVASPKYRKICAIGVHMSRWVSMHGFALNVQTDLSMFEGIIPCGIVDENKTVTSMSKELNKKVELPEVKEVLKTKFAEVYEFEWAI